MLVFPQNTVSIPRETELLPLDLALPTGHYFGQFMGTPCFTVGLPAKVALPPEITTIPPRQLYGQLPEELFWIALRAHHLATWDETHRFCGQCATPLQMKQQERAKFCPSCGHTVFPRISPAVIVAVTKGDQILLANGLGWKSNYYGVLAGFLEPGESLEECVHREVMEEVGIGIKNVQYFGSQPWGFPDQVMIGFTAEYASGEINIDPEELSGAGWFKADNIPGRWGKPSIGTELVEWFIAQHK